MKNRLRGFTLIEVMITVAIIGILAAIAYPSYIEQVRKSRRADAKAALLSAAQIMERRYTETNGYLGTAPGDVAGSPFADHAPIDRPHASATYNITMPAGAAPLLTVNTYTLIATRTGAQTSDTTCGDYTLTSTGIKGVTVGTVANCW